MPVSHLRRTVAARGRLLQEDRAMIGVRQWMIRRDLWLHVARFDGEWRWWIGVLLPEITVVKTLHRTPLKWRREYGACEAAIVLKAALKAKRERNQQKEAA